jgi:hypothetical protein
MPVMADIDDPPKSRWRGILLGLLVASPLGLGLGLVFLPSLYGQIMGGIGAFDAQLRVDDEFMKTLCVDALDVDRDEALCGCAIPAEFPSLDCQSQFSSWMLLEQHRRCASEHTRQEAIGFCACVDTLAEQVTAATESGDSKAARMAGQRYRACAALDDALARPTIESLQ